MAHVTTNFTEATSLTFNGQAAMTCCGSATRPAACFAACRRIFYNGGGDAGDALESLSGSADSGSYVVGPGIGDRVITHTNGADPGDHVHRPGADHRLAVVEPIFTIDGTDAANNITLDDGALGDGLIRVSIDAFEPIPVLTRSTW